MPTRLVFRFLLRPLLALALVALTLLDRRSVAAETNPGYSVDLWRSDDGAPQNNVDSMAQSGDGFLWMATDEVVARFDGVRFVTVEVDQFVDIRRNALMPSAPPGPIEGPFRVFSTADHALWLTGGGGAVWRWTGHEFARWTRPDPLDDAITHIFEAHGQIRAVTADGNIFAGADGKFTQIARGGPLCAAFEKSGRMTLLCQTNPSGMAEIGPDGASHGIPEEIPGATCLDADGSGGVWAGGDGGLYRVRDGHAAAIPPPAASFTVAKVIAAPDGNCWVTSGRQVWLYRANAWHEIAGARDILLPNDVQMVDGSGCLWVAPSGVGFWRLDLNGAITKFGPEDGIPADAAAGCIDLEGNTWISIYRAGIARLRSKRFSAVTVNNYLHAASLWGLAEDRDGSMWFSPEFKGPVRWKNGEQTEFKLANFKRNSGWAQGVAVDHQGQIWVAANNDGLYRQENGDFRMEFPWPREAGYCSAIYQDRRGAWWMGSNYGLQSCEGGLWKNWGAAQGLPAPATHAIAEDVEGHLWVGLYLGGLACLDGDRFKVFGVKEGLKTESIYTVVPGADGSLWIGGHGALARRKNGRFTNYTTAQGLPDSHVVQVLQDGRGGLWLGTRAGVCRIPIASFDAVDRGESTMLDALLFDSSDGLPTSACQGRCSPACVQAHDGALWFLTARGAAYCRPEEVIRNTVRPSVLLESVTVDEHLWQEKSAAADPLARLTTAPRGPLALPPGQHLLEFQYTATSLTSPEKVRFKYRLEGLDRTWVEAGSRRSALYSFLPHGAYRFHVIACNNDGLWNETGAALDITVAPFFWQRWWFPIVIAGLIACVAGGLVALWMRVRHRRRMARLELEAAREGERIRISRDLHDDLGASLTEIGMLAADASSAPSPDPATGAQVRTIAEKAQSLVTALDTIVWAVDPQKDTLPALASFVGSFVEEYTAAAALDCRIDIQQSLPERPLSSDFRHSIFLAVKEAVHNAVKHAHARRITLEMFLAGENLNIRVVDDGCGFDLQNHSAGNGLMNLQQRLANLRGICNIRTSPGNGAAVSFSLPLPSSQSPYAQDHGGARRG